MSFFSKKSSTGKGVEASETYAPPQDPPLSRGAPQDAVNDLPPSYEEWMTIRENPSHSDLPPPPTIHHDQSSVHNASSTNESLGWNWCNRNSLWSPQDYGKQTQSDIVHGRAHLVPAHLLGSHAKLPRPERTPIQTLSGNGTSQYQTFISTTPLYSAICSRPYAPGEKFVAYFEIQVIDLRAGNGGIALGFAAPPYPHFRLPGWERASMAVHGDDGHRFVNDSYGGLDFTQPFKRGETIGIGMEFSSKGKQNKAITHRCDFERPPFYCERVGYSHLFSFEKGDWTLV